jgi:MFS family permease
MKNLLKNFQIGIAEILRLLSTEILMILIPILGINILNLNNSSIGFAISLSSIGFLIFGYIAGLIADSWNRKYMMVTLLLIKSLLFGMFAYLALSSNLTKLNYFLIIFLIGLVIVIIETTLTAWIPDIYSKDELAGINSLLQFSRSSANLLGPALGGVVIGIFGEELTMTFISCSLLISSILMLGIKNSNKVTVERTRKINIIKNIKYILKNNILKSIVLTTSTINFSMSMYGAIVIIFLIKDLKLSESLTGIILSLGGVGALLYKLKLCFTSSRAPAAFYQNDLL